MGVMHPRERDGGDGAEAASCGPKPRFLGNEGGKAGGMGWIRSEKTRTEGLVGGRQMREQGLALRMA